ncbi:formate dehydrogenase subunit gamma [Pseudooceanicola sp. 216_PA32_1]|uniref:Formate dehydrogenase subunit gamma n=1 Tax=Pseudooceanicola pacificus TaxID=2676438 RepID=A0A844W6T6_9RHOB|nr:formate dehydrogenase subunit gamma [Pseudooceanicola pacificus]MWB78541.1 formate dehydrogenase subunit gamma [Pseudooceanicola pacificus]
MSPSTPPSEAEIDAIVAAHMSMEGPMLPILHALQAAFGHVPQAAVPRIAQALNQTRAEVHGVVSFYHDFRDAPVTGRVVRLCRAEACQASGGAAVAEAVMQTFGIGWGESKGGVTLEPVYCLGLCACGPAAQVDGRLHGRVDAARIEALVAEGAA